MFFRKKGQKCAKCGYTLQKGFQYCPICGHKFEIMKKMPEELEHDFSHGIKQASLEEDFLSAEKTDYMEDEIPDENQIQQAIHSMESVQPGDEIDDNGEY